MIITIFISCPEKAHECFVALVQENKMDIKIIKAGSDRLREKPGFNDNLTFGDIFTDHMLVIDYNAGN
jgi:hypothetical protein